MMGGNLEKENIKAFTKPTYKRLHPTHGNENKLLIGTRTYSTFLRSSIHKYLLNSFYIPGASISTGVYSPSEIRTSEETRRIKVCAVVEVSMGCAYSSELDAPNR